MKTDQVMGRCVTSVRATSGLSDGLKDATLGINVIMGGEVMNLVDDGSEEDINQETEDYAQIEHTEDHVTPLVITLSLFKRLNESDRMYSEDGLEKVHDGARKQEEITILLNGMIHSIRMNVIDLTDEVVSRDHCPSQMHPVVHKHDSLNREAHTECHPQLVRIPSVYHV